MVTRNFGAGVYGAGAFGKASTYQVAIDLGSYVLSGQVAQFLQLHLTTGALALVGQSANLLKSSKAIAQGTILVLSGAGTLALERIFSSAHGNFSLVGGSSDYALGSIWTAALPIGANWTAAVSQNDIWTPAEETQWPTQ